ncbi:Y-family DNA polymerase [Chryseobacterium sp. POL2]|uniref:Y-family DNA polymerase n=1 Tax=Chryseobacterium sp. POL2 TaxID=2713414 RepID=UPI0013E16999|nr:Y-family DNA polymerase [Chryseobacterium sp. POL2]QIG90131.1 Y-family DNA polymerase [Chryseobacterium sp. POL2]
MFALIDCNNFFVSCERSLDATLQEKPVVVLSNNDGCVISRSNEAKALGIPMGAPAYQFKALFHHHHVTVLSAKFELYNYKSQGVIDISKSYAPEHEVYSIDELFLDFHGFKYVKLQTYATEIRNRVQREMDIPVSIGIAPTKTLCKVANRIVKKFPNQFPDGVYILDSKEKIEKALKWLSIEDVWGIGRRYANKMKDAGVYKAYDLLQKPEIWVRKIMGIHGARMLNELKGIPQLDLEKASDKKSITVSRSFMEMITEKDALRERIETFALYCAEKLRKQNSCCKSLSIYIGTNRFRKDLPAYNGFLSINLDNPTNSSIVLARAASQLFEQVFVEGFSYKKAGVFVSNFVPENARITSLFEDDVQNKHLPIMRAMDKLNRKYGKDKIRLGSMTGENTYGRKIMSEAYEHFLKNNTLPEANFRFFS